MTTTHTQSTANPSLPTTSPSPATPAGKGTHGSESSNWPSNAPSCTPIFPSGSRSTFELSLTLPWPPTKLSPNDSSHWAKKAPIRRALRRDSALLTLAAYQQAKKNGARIDPDRPVTLSVLFVRPDRRHHDRDNLIARSKALFDGIADALGINDRMFRFSQPEISEDIGGMVKVEIRQ